MRGGERTRPESRWRPVLRPFPGRRLPEHLAPRRVGRLAERLAAGVRDPGFETLLSEIDQALVHTGNRVELFFRGPEAFAAMLAAVESAAAEVLLESYILRDDPTGRRFADALIAARRRGVRVRVLADAFGSWRTPAAFWRRLRGEGIESRLFSPLWTSSLRTVQLRDHRKILVVDRRIAFTGGMNIGEEYGSSTRPRGGVFRDTHARVEGTAAWEMAVVFREGWRRAGGSRFPIENAAPSGSPGARVLVLDTRPRRGAREFAASMSALVGATRERLWLTTAYFAPRFRGVRLLGRAARRGVDVRLLVPGRTDVPLVRHAGHGFFSALLSRGIRVFEYQAAILHAKTAVADGCVSIVGSSNLDFRSFELNAECNFAIFDEPSGRAMEQRFERDLAESVEIRLGPWRRRGRVHRLGDTLARSLAPIL